MSNLNREQWLQQAAVKLVPLFEKAGYKVPETRVSTGFPSKSALAAKRRKIGECWSDKLAADSRCQIFITPLLEDSTRVLDVLAHEMVHAVVGLEAKHGAAFSRCAKAIGLTGKMTATVAGPELQAELEGIVRKIGTYPHAGLNAMTNGEKKQTTRMIKCACPACGYTARTTRKWLEDAGAPLCPCNGEPMEVAGEA